MWHYKAIVNFNDSGVCSFSVIKLALPRCLLAKLARLSYGLLANFVETSCHVTAVRDVTLSPGQKRVFKLVSLWIGSVSANGVSALTRKWESSSGLFLLHAGSFCSAVRVVVSEWLSLSRQGRCDSSPRRASLLAGHSGLGAANSSGRRRDFRRQSRRVRVFSLSTGPLSPRHSWPVCQ